LDAAEAAVRNVNVHVQFVLAECVQGMSRVVCGNGGTGRVEGSSGGPRLVAECDGCAGWVRIGVGRQRDGRWPRQVAAV
jgi:hypothetical protein